MVPGLSQIHYLRNKIRVPVENLTGTHFHLFYFLQERFVFSENTNLLKGEKKQFRSKKKKLVVYIRVSNTYFFLLSLNDMLNMESSKWNFRFFKQC